MKPTACKIYLEKQKSKALTNNIPVSNDTELIIVIPCYNEPDIEKTLDSLFSCDTGGFCTEIILLINSYEISSTGHRIDDQPEAHRQHRHEDGVEQEAADRNPAEDLGVVVEADVADGQEGAQ